MKKSRLLFLLLAGTLMLNCGSNKKTTEPDPQPEYDIPIDVGSVHARLKIVKLNLTGGMLRGELMEVLGYGANTEPMKTGSELHCIISENVNTAGLEEQKLVDVQIRQAPSGMGMETSRPHWTIVKILSSN